MIVSSLRILHLDRFFFFQFYNVMKTLSLVDTEAFHNLDRRDSCLTNSLINHKVSLKKLKQKSVSSIEELFQILYFCNRRVSQERNDETFHTNGPAVFPFLGRAQKLRIDFFLFALIIHFDGQWSSTDLVQVHLLLDHCPLHTSRKRYLVGKYSGFLCGINQERKT